LNSSRRFAAFVSAQGLELDTTSFRLHGNIKHPETGAAVEHERASLLLEAVFDAQGD
jgi:hypothetical protein